MSGKTPIQSIVDYKLLSQSPLFHGVDQEIIMKLISLMQRQQWPRGYHMSSSQQFEGKFYLILKGRVKVGRHHLTNARELTLFLLGPGDGFNILSLIDGAGKNLQVDTLDEVEVLSTSRQNWIDWMEQYPSLLESTAKAAAAQIEHLTDLATELAMDDTMTRLVHLLLRYFNPSSNGQNLIKDLPQEELAQMIGTVRPVLARLLTELRNEGIVAVEGREINVQNMEQLLARANHQLDVLHDD